MDEETKKLSPLNRTAKMGRPEYWTKERLESLCERLDSWANKSDAISMTEFRSEEELTMNMISYLKEISNDFSKRYDLAKEKIANRISKKAGRGVHPIHYNRYISLYDVELQQHDMAMASAKAQSAAAAKQEQIDEGKGVMERLSSTLSTES